MSILSPFFPFLAFPSCQPPSQKVIPLDIWDHFISFPLLPAGGARTRLTHLQFFFLGEDLDKSLSRLHKARCRMSEVTRLRQLTILPLSLATICSTQKVLGDGAPHR